MILIVIGLIAGVIGGFMAQSKGKNVLLWALLCGLFPIAILFLAFAKTDEAPVVRVHMESAPQPYPIRPIEYVAPQTVQSPAYDQDKWSILCDVDSEIRSANDAVSRYGKSATVELATKYLKLNDKAYLQTLVASIVATYEKVEETKRLEAESRQLVLEHAKYEGEFWGVKWKKGDEGPIFADIGSGQQEFETNADFEKSVKEAWRAKNATGRA